jgi:thioredoxin reductase (NADPH)
MNLLERRKVIILGSGPAGLTAGLYSARAMLNPLLLEGEPISNTDQPGGQLMLTTEVENFPGFPEGIIGPELIAQMKQQAIKFGAQVVSQRAHKVDLQSYPFKVYPTPACDSYYEAEALIVATGARSLLLGVPGEQELMGHGVSTCATCDGFFFRNKEIAVVGGGDSALEEALFLTRYAAKVTIIHRRDVLRASKVMQQRAFNNEKIQFLWNKRVTQILGSASLEQVVLEDTQTGDLQKLDLDGLFVAIGHAPATELFEGQLQLDERGYIKTLQGTQTNVRGVFACGDVQDPTYRQAITAAGSGCMAAIDAERFLASQED